MGIIPSVDSVRVPLSYAQVSLSIRLRQKRIPNLVIEVVISGIGGIGHMAVQYAVAMGLNVAAVDIDDEKLAFAEKLGAKVTINAKTQVGGNYYNRKSAARMEY